MKQATPATVVGAMSGHPLWGCPFFLNYQAL